MSDIDISEPLSDLLAPLNKRTKGVSDEQLYNTDPTKKTKPSTAKGRLPLI